MTNKQKQYYHSSVKRAVSSGDAKYGMLKGILIVLLLVLGVGLIAFHAGTSDVSGKVVKFTTTVKATAPTRLGPNSQKTYTYYAFNKHNHDVADFSNAKQAKRMLKNPKQFHQYSRGQQYIQRHGDIIMTVETADHKKTQTMRIDNVKLVGYRMYGRCYLWGGHHAVKLNQGYTNLGQVKMKISARVVK